MAVEISSAQRSGYELVISTDQKYSPRGLNWLEPKTQVNLTEVLFDNGKECYLGSAIGKNKDLREIASKLTSTQSRKAQDAFYARLPEFVNNGYDRQVFTVDLPNTEDGQKIYYVKSSKDLRTYFTMDKDAAGQPVIIRVAVCQKSQEWKVLKVLAKTAKQFNK